MDRPTNNKAPEQFVYFETLDRLRCVADPYEKRIIIKTFLEVTKDVIAEFDVS